MNKQLVALAQFWDARYRSPTYVFGTEPNAYLVQQVQHIPAPAKALCLADGEGRNGVWLASQGYTVTSIDISTTAAEKAAQLASQKGVTLAFVVADLATYDFGNAQYDLITSIFLHLPRHLRKTLHQQCFKALAPGGIFVWESFTSQQLEKNTGGPKEANLLFTLDDVLQDFPDGVIVHAYEGLGQLDEGASHRGEAFISQFSVMKRLG